MSISKNKNIEDIYPLSPMQEGLLFHSLFAPASGVYVGQKSYELQGRLDIDAFKRAWQEVIDRHPILRTAFVWGDREKPIQIVGSRVKFPLEQQDWRGLSSSQQAKQLKAFLQSDRHRGFELSKAPLMRLTLIQLFEDTYQFTWSHHHLLLDGWSLPLLFKEVLAFYEAFCLNQNLHLKSPRPYRDYIAWLQQQDITQAEEFWRHQLSGFCKPTPLVVDHLSKSPIDQSVKTEDCFAKQHLQFSATDTAKLQSFARQHQLTLSTLIQGVWALLLSRYSAEDDVVFGVTSSGRPTDLAGSESMIGNFINTLPMRVKVTPEEPLLPWLQQLQKQQIDSRQYEYSPLVEIQGWSEVPRGTPLFESIIVAENYLMTPALRKWRGNLKISQVHSILETHYPLTLLVGVYPQFLIDIAYDSHRFEADTIARMLGHVRTLLEGIVANPSRCLSSLPILTEAEQHQQLIEWNQTEAEYPEACLHELFEVQVERTPDAVALVFEEHHLTYRELNERSNQLAHYLQGQGVGPESLVGVCLERSVEMVIALLGVLKAGGAYVPIDPSHPSERLTYILEDTQLSILLMSRATLAEQLSLSSVQVVDLNTDWLSIAQECLIVPAVPSRSPQHSAYVIYTSGSTGTPKGVQMPHEAISNHMAWMQENLSLTTLDKVPFKTPFSFDASIWEIYAPLLAGAQLVVAAPEGHRDITYLTRLILRKEITVLQLVPSLFQVFLEAPNIEQYCQSLHTLFCGGEVLSTNLQERFWARSLDSKLCNLYGPTETCIDTTSWECEQICDSPTVPIGRPIANTQVYVLDQAGQPVPVGVPGELHIGGIQLARGYYRRPGLTAERFVPHPFSETPGARLYKTGDLVKYRPDGTLEYLGRLDHQVKLRGFRIELSEIERVLEQHPEVAQAVVVAHGAESTATQLVGYVVPVSDANPSSATLRRFLTTQLPEYMVPAALVSLETLPLTPNGKVDRKALPTPEQSLVPQGGDFVPPQSPTEEVLAHIWSQVLGLEALSRHSHFFELGGHSLMATRVISQVRQTFGVEVPLRRLFECPTIAELATAIEAALHEDHGLSLPPLTRVERTGALPLSFAQQRLWFLAQLDPESPFYSLSSALHLRGSLDVAALQASLDALVQRHEVLRLGVVSRGGHPQVALHSALGVPLSVIDLRALSSQHQGHLVPSLVATESRRPFALDQPPLLRVSLLHLSQAEQVLVFTMHHIVSDGWSMGVLVREVATLYGAFVTGQPVALPSLPVQYLDYAAWQREWLQGETLEHQRHYWQQQLAGAPAVLELPTDSPRPAVQSFRGARHTFAIDPGLTDALKQLSRQHNSTLFMTLLAAFQVVLSRYSGQEDIVVGSPIANRTQADVEGLIGFFVNTLVLRTSLAGDPSFVEVLRRVREVTLGAYAHQEMPFEQVVELLQPQRDLSYSPLFQVMFILQNAPQERLALPALEVEFLETETGTAKFDLTLAMQEVESGLQGQLEYNCDLFEPSTMERLVRHLQQVLAAVVAQPEQRLSEVSLLTADERQRLLVEWNQTEAEYLEGNVHQFFEAQVERTPDAVALVFEEQQLTYGELNCRANQLAHYLQSQGVGTESLVGVCLERSVEMVIALLGVLKAGGAYVPLDPSYPAERLTFMLQDSDVPLVLTQSTLLGALPPEVTYLSLDIDWAIIAASDESPLEHFIAREHLSYVIYTSGSTGRPKGAMNTHHGMCNRLHWMQATYQLTPADRVLQKTPFSFDVSVWEFFWPLMTGASLVVAQPEGHKDSHYLAQLIAKEQVSILHFVPSMLQIFLEAPYVSSHCKSLRHVICSGEALSMPLQQRYFQCLEANLHNLYGPTEAAIDVTAWACDKQQDGSSVPIGRPIANTQVYVLDRADQPVPVGVPGELHIGGIQLARGYYHRPGLTAERFVPHPFSETPGARLYKTGDLVKYRPDGTLEYLGRLDHQVKLRGFRIELGEIEATLNQHPGVQNSVVVVRESELGSLQLIAYVVQQSDQNLSTSDLRHFLEKRLPQYMRPAVFVFLDALPLTPNGKLNRQALPMPNAARPELDQLFTLSRNPTEAKLSEIWASILRLEQVGIHDNFFELGGDSILSLQVISKANQAGLNLTPKQLFQHQTIAQLAAVANTTKKTQAAQNLVTGSLELTPIQHYFFEQEQTQPHYWNQAVLLQVKKRINPVALEKVVQHLQKYHDILRSRFTKKEAGFQAVIVTPDHRVPLTYLDLSALPEEKQVAEIETTAAHLQASLNLTEGPLFRVALFDLGVNQPSRLLWVIHHLVIDGVSWRILIEDFQTVYRQISQDRELRLPSKTTSFQQWSSYLREYAQSSELYSELDYWLAIKQRPVKPIPLDFNYGNNLEESACTVAVSLTVEETQVLLQQVPAVYRTQINDVFLTALMQTFTQWTGETSLLINLEGHGREELFEDVDLSRTVGWFTTMFPVSLSLENAFDSPGQALKSIKEQLRAIPTRGIGYGVLRYLSRDMAIREPFSRLPKAEVVFNYLGQFDQVLLKSSLFSLAQESSGSNRSLRSKRTHLLEINGDVSEGRLQVNWTYSSNLHRRSTVEQLAQRFIEAMRLLIAHCQSPDAGGFTPSDFAEFKQSQWDQRDLDAITTVIGDI